jgi:predicted metal-dependent hydrolase
LELPRAPYLTAERWRDHEAYLWGVDLYNHGFGWEAHEAWEGLWRAAKHDDAQATFVQGLIQCAAARVKASMGDEAATQRLLERGLARLSHVQAQQGDRYMGLELARYLSEHASATGAFPYLWLSAS